LTSDSQYHAHTGYPLGGFSWRPVKLPGAAISKRQLALIAFRDLRRHHKPVKTFMSGPCERERVSECLEESPLRLARSFRAPKSWDVSRREGRTAAGGFKGAEAGHSRYVAESSQVFGAPALAGTPLNPSKPVVPCWHNLYPGKGASFAPAPTRYTRPKP
jgi:hypothetical protein